MQRSLADFLAMGGYASFVWTSYAAWALVIGANIWGALHAHSQARRGALRRLAMQDGERAGDDSGVGP